MKEKLDPRIKAVGVFVDAPLEEAAELLKSGVIDLAQLHGSEDGEYVKRLKEMTGNQVIKGRPGRDCGRYHCRTEQRGRFSASGSRLRRNRRII